jgi:hypothetical protein
MQTCPACGGHVEMIVCIEMPAALEKIVNRLDDKGASTGNRRLSARTAPPQAGSFDCYTGKHTTGATGCYTDCAGWVAVGLRTSTKRSRRAFRNQAY